MALQAFNVSRRIRQETLRILLHILRMLGEVIN